MKIANHFKEYFTAWEQPEVIDIEEAAYISILGKGSPGTDTFYEKKKAITQWSKVLEQHFEKTTKAFENDIVEIFYWYDEEKVGYVDIGNFYTTVDLSLLHYRIAIRIPNAITASEVTQIIENNPDFPFADGLEHFVYKAGKSVQLLHKGPFADELETLPVLQQFATENGFKKSGMHHEIHLTPFEKGQSQVNLRTILRDPVVEIN